MILGPILYNGYLYICRRIYALLSICTLYMHVCVFLNYLHLFVLKVRELLFVYFILATGIAQCISPFSIIIKIYVYNNDCKIHMYIIII